MSDPDFHRLVREELAQITGDPARDEDIVEELAHHLAQRFDEMRERGLDDSVALDAVLRELRDTRLREAISAADRPRPMAPVPAPSRRGLLFRDLGRDIRYAVRTLLRERGFAGVVVITLALGLGGTTAAYSAIDAILVRSLPIPDADRAVSVYMLWSAHATANPVAGDQVGSSSYPDYVDLRASDVLNGLAAFADIGVTLDRNGVAERVEGQIVTDNFFGVLGVRPVIGRAFTPDEDRAGAPVRVVVLSYGTWQRRFGGDAGMIGRSISLNGNPYVVIGVAPRGFAGAQLGDAVELWVPMAMQPEVRPPSAGGLRQRFPDMRMLDARDVRWLDMVGRLQEGMSVADAAAALDVVGRRMQTAHPDSNRDITATAMPLGEGPGLRRNARPLLWVLAGAVVLVMLIACANVASLLLARAVTRRREVAIRMAIGAGRGQLVRQWLTEALLLGALGSAAALVVAYWAIPILYGFGIPDGVDLGLNMRVLAFTFAIGGTAAVIFGLTPVLQLIRPEAVAALRDEGGTVATGIRATRARSAFVVVQVALSLVLLVGAGLFLRTLQQAYAVELGYRVDRMLIANIDAGDRYTPVTGYAFHSDVLARLNALPGVVAAGAARITVLSGGARTMPVSLDGRPLQRDGNIIPVRANVVSERYLEAMGIPILMGRNFQATDLPTSPHVAIVSRSLVDRLWPNADPLGKTLQSVSPLVVVGVVPDTVYRTATDRQPLPVYYTPLSQNYEASVTLHVRTAGDPMAILPAVRRVVRDVDSRVALGTPRRLEDEFSRSLIEERTLAKFVGGLSGIALLLAAVGLYGVMAYATRQRRTEIGVRLTLGATPVSILTMVVQRGLSLVAAGAVCGLAGATVAARYVRAQLFGVAPSDPTTWIAVSVALVCVGLLACALPAWRAMRIDPVAALRGS